MSTNIDSGIKEECLLSKVYGIYSFSCRNNQITVQNANVKIGLKIGIFDLSLVSNFLQNYGIYCGLIPKSESGALRLLAGMYIVEVQARRDSQLTTFKFLNSNNNKANLVFTCPLCPMLSPLT
jgi:hypothetical protein